MKKTFLIALAATALAAPAYADHHSMSKAEHDKMHKEHTERLAKILADPSRGAERQHAHGHALAHKLTRHARHGAVASQRLHLAAGDVDGEYLGLA